MPLLLDPKLILDYIDLWHKDPNTPMPDFKLTPGQSHMLTHVIQEGKWKFEKARQIKKAQYRKERFLKKNIVSMTTEELVTIQSEIEKLSDEFDAYHADWLGAKVRFVRLADNFTSTIAAQSQQEIPRAAASAQPTKENASTADDTQAAEENANSRADDCIPAAEKIARATSSVAPEENEEVGATASVMPEDLEPNSSAPPATTPTHIPLSASDVEKTKAAE